MDSKLSQPKKTGTAVFILASLFLQVLIFFILINLEKSGPLGGLTIFQQGLATMVIILFHGVLILINADKFQYKVAFICSICFWIIAWASFTQWENKNEARETKKKEFDQLQNIELMKNLIGALLSEKDITAEWLQDSLCFKIYQDDSTRYYVKPEFDANGRVWVCEKMRTAPSLEDTVRWLEKLNTVIPLLSIDKLARLNKILYDKSYCLESKYKSFICLYPCSGDLLQ